MHSEEHENLQPEFQDPSVRDSYLDRSPGVRIFIGLCCLVLFFIMFEYRQSRVEILEPHSVAQKYVVAQTDFEFPDEEATFTLKMQAIRDIDQIYRFEEGKIQERMQQLQDYTVKKEEWRHLAEQTTFDELDFAIGLWSSTLLKIRFTDSRTLQKMKQLQVPINDYIIFTPSETDVRVRIPNNIWRQIEKMAFNDQSVTKSTRNFLIDYFKDQTWNLEEDKQESRALKTLAESKVKEKYTKVKAGSRIIDQGEKVTPRHVMMLQSMKNALNETRNPWDIKAILGSLLLSFIFVFVGATYIRFNHSRVFHSNKKLSLLFSIFLITYIFAKAVEFLFITNAINFIELIHYPIFTPLAAILICALINSRIAAICGCLLTILLTISLAVDRTPFLIINIITGTVAVISTKSLRKRKQIFVVCTKTWLSCIVVIIAIYLMNHTWSSAILSDIISTCIFMVIIAVLSVGLLPLLEGIFHVMTDITLMEYLDPSHPLLRRLAIEAPGTYQHSMVVANLAEAAAIAIGGNSMFCRVATLYHDIGKLTAPHYFTENQQAGVNIHQLLTPTESVQVILSHVSEGVAMARKAGLPESFIDIIKEHHGTTLVSFFYDKEIELQQKERLETLVNEGEFRYSGPKPKSKESAIIMIADSVEAASRSLDELTTESVSHLIEQIVKSKADDAQFDECLLTFEELRIVKKTILKALVAAGHSRIKYPSKKIKK